MHRRIPAAYMLYAIFVVAFAVLFLVKPAFGPIDDHRFVQTLLRGDPLPMSIWPEIGRFFPLNGQVYNLVGLFSTDPFWFYAVNAAEFLLFAWVLGQVMRVASNKPALIAGIPLLLFLSPGFTGSWFRLLVPEREAALFFGLFLVVYARVQAKNSRSLIVLAFVFANLALYYKEPGFLMLGVFAGSHLALSWKTSPRHAKILDSLLLASSVAFAIMYYALIYSQRGEVLYTGSRGDVVAFIPRALFSYTTTGPALILGLFPLAAFRTWRIARRADKPHPLFDPMILGALTYVLTYFVLRIRTPYYLFPAYMFALPAMVHFATEYWSKRLVKRVASLVLVVYAVSALPIGLSTLSRNKYVPINYTQTVDYLTTELQQAARDDPPVIFLDGVNRGTGMEAYVSLRTFLEYEHLAFDLGSTLPINNEFLFEADPSSPYTAYRTREPSVVQSGDFLVVCESCINSSLAINEYLARLENEYELRFSTESPLAIPELSLRNLTKLVVSQYLSDANREALMGRSENLFYGPDYYVFVKR